MPRSTLTFFTVIDRDSRVTALIVSADDRIPRRSAIILTNLIKDWQKSVFCRLTASFYFQRHWRVACNSPWCTATDLDGTALSSSF